MVQQLRTKTCEVSMSNLYKARKVVVWSLMNDTEEVLMQRVVNEIYSQSDVLALVNALFPGLNCTLTWVEQNPYTFMEMLIEGFARKALGKLFPELVGVAMPEGEDASKRLDIPGCVRVMSPGEDPYRSGSMFENDFAVWLRSAEA